MQCPVCGVLGVFYCVALSDEASNFWCEVGVVCTALLMFVIGVLFRVSKCSGNSFCCPGKHHMHILYPTDYLGQSRHT